MKPNARILGVDDGPFRRGQARALLVGVVTQGPSYVEGVLTDDCAVDGTDATERILRLVGGTRFAPTLRCVFLNGVAVGGFNVVDLDALHERCGIPVVALVRHRPDLAAIRAALLKNFDDGAERWAIVERARPQRVRNGRHTLYASARGVASSDLPRILAASTVKGALPEPLRLAHVVASGVTRGESRGKA